MPNTKRRFFPFFIAIAAFSGSLNAQTVRFQTTFGGIDVVLTPNVTPMTVANFMSYVNSGAYTNTIFDRSLGPNGTAMEPPYIIQGGSFVVEGVFVNPYSPVNAPVTNEFNLANCPNMACNVLGTLAMALNSSSINSGQNEWYFNLSDNSSFYDSGDYTVFGNVANSASLAVANAINALPAYAEDYGTNANFGDLPLQNYTCCDSKIMAANFIFINSITQISPAISAAGVADAATAASSNSTGISPGEILTLYGKNYSQNPPAPSYLGPTQLVTLTLDSAGTGVTTSLEGTQVLFNGIAGPMIYTSDGQLAVVVPYEIAGQSTVSVVVSYLGFQTASIQFNVVPATPGLFTVNETGKGDAAIVRPNSDGSVSYISTSNPASPGDSLELYGEGYGVESPSLPDGAVVGSTNILPLPAATTILLIDGQPVGTCGGPGSACSYAGGAGGEINGVLQVNFVVPQLTPGSHSIQVKVGNAVSPTGVNLQTK